MATVSDSLRKWLRKGEPMPDARYGLGVYMDGDAARGILCQKHSSAVEIIGYEKVEIEAVRRGASALAQSADKADSMELLRAQSEAVGRVVEALDRPDAVRASALLDTRMLLKETPFKGDPRRKAAERVDTAWLSSVDGTDRGVADFTIRQNPAFNTGQGAITVLAARESLVDHLRKTVSPNFVPDLLTAAPLALLNGIEGLVTPPGANQALVVVDFGFARTLMCVYGSVGPLVFRSMPLGVTHVQTETRILRSADSAAAPTPENTITARTLVDRIETFLSYYARLDTARKGRYRIVLCGMGSRLRNLKERIQDRLKLPVEQISWRGNVAMHSRIGDRTMLEREGPSYCIPYGLARQAVGEASLAIDLLAQTDGVYFVKGDGSMIRVDQGRIYELDNRGNRKERPVLLEKRVHGQDGKAVALAIRKREAPKPKAAGKPEPAARSKGGKRVGPRRMRKGARSSEEQAETLKMVLVVYLFIWIMAGAYIFFFHRAYAYSKVARARAALEGKVREATTAGKRPGQSASLAALGQRAPRRFPQPPLADTVSRVIGQVLRIPVHPVDDPTGGGVRERKLWLSLVRYDDRQGRAMLEAGMSESAQKQRGGRKARGAGPGPIEAPLPLIEFRGESNVLGGARGAEAFRAAIHDERLDDYRLQWDVNSMVQQSYSFALSTCPRHVLPLEAKLTPRGKEHALLAIWAPTPLAGHVARYDYCLFDASTGKAIKHGAVKGQYHLAETVADTHPAEEYVLAVTAVASDGSRLLSGRAEVKSDPAAGWGALETYDPARSEVTGRLAAIKPAKGEAEDRAEPILVLVDIESGSEGNRPVPVKDGKFSLAVAPGREYALVIAAVGDATPEKRVRFRAPRYLESRVEENNPVDDKSRPASGKANLK